VLDDVGQLTVSFSGGPGGTIVAPGDDGPCPGICRGGKFETHHNHLGASHILATGAHNLEDIFGLCWRLVANCVSC
jgi:hypothetical protein